MEPGKQEPEEKPGGYESGDQEGGFKELMLSRLHQVGEGNRLRSKGYEWTLREESRMREEREGQ